MSAWAPIEGETPIDPSFIKDKTIKTRAALNTAQAENIRKAVVKYFAGRLTRAMARFDYAWFLKLHEEMFGDVLACAGQQRAHDLNLGVKWGQISEQLAQLEQNLVEWQNHQSPLEQAVRLHYESVRIHPFYDGNGRWARMLGNVWLRLNKHPITEWPEAQIGETSPIRNEYLSAIRTADTGDLDALLALHARYTKQA